MQQPLLFIYSEYFFLSRWSHVGGLVSNLRYHIGSHLVQKRGCWFVVATTGRVHVCSTIRTLHDASTLGVEVIGGNIRVELETPRDGNLLRLLESLRLRLLHHSESLFVSFLRHSIPLGLSLLRERFTTGSTHGGITIPGVVVHVVLPSPIVVHWCVVGPGDIIRYLALIIGSHYYFLPIFLFIIKILYIV